MATSPIVEKGASSISTVGPSRQRDKEPGQWDTNAESFVLQS
jgi:hypothetical protein